MINRELVNITVQTYSTSPDAYGQMATGTATSTRSIVGCVKINNKSYVTDIRYVDIDIIVLTKDNLVTDSNRLLINGQQYQIETIIPAYTNRGYTQLLCKAIK